MRKLKFHEKKLLKKTDFLDWKKEHNGHEIKVVRRYHLQDREDYTRYNYWSINSNHRLLGITESVVSS